MTAPDLSVYFRPHGVAVIGASRDPVKLGYGVVRNLVQHHYPGPVYPVNPNADEIMDLRAYPNIASVPDPVDLAVIVVPAGVVAAELEACGKRGIKAVIVVSGGFREVGPQGLQREEQLKQIAQQYGIALLGPNCIGTIDTHTPLNTTFVTGSPVPGDIALLSQSGAIAAAVIDWARGSGVGLSRIVSLGNQAGVTESQMLEAIAGDLNTRVVIAYIEGVSDGAAFLESAQYVAQSMPVLALKVGRGSSGARAVASHTGALAGSEAAYDAAFRRAGVLRAGRLEEMLDWARALAWQPLPQGDRVAILTNAGGPGIMAVDALEAAGMRLAPLTEATRDFLRQRVPAAASVQNPVDVLAGSGPATYALCLDALLADETVDAVAVMTAPQDWFEPVSLAEVVGEVGNSALGRRKPVLACIMGLASTSGATEVLHRRRIPNFAFPERLGSTLAAMWQRRRWLDAQASQSEPQPVEGCDRQTAQAVAQAGLAVMRQHIEREGADPVDAGWMPADQVDALLTAYSIPTPRTGMAPGVDHALALADSIGYPVALKLAAPSLTHKSDVGGVLLNITGPEALREGFQTLLDNASRQSPVPAVVEGVYVQQMVRGLAEVIVGVVRDPQFGPLVMVGAGGTAVELVGDVTFELAPLTRDQADAMLDHTTVGRRLAGYRGAAPADRAAVVDVILRLAQIAVDHPAIAEIEINPLIVMAQGAAAVDARLRLAEEV